MATPREYATYTKDEYKNMFKEFFATEAELKAFIEKDEPNEMIDETADSLVDVYNHNLWDWAYDQNDLNAALEDITKEYGDDFVGETIRLHGIERLFMIAQNKFHSEKLWEAYSELKNA